MNQLFATLDINCFQGFLPSNIKVLYLDTVGFISDIPNALLNAFSVTLEDVVHAVSPMVTAVIIFNYNFFKTSTLDNIKNCNNSYKCWL